MAAALNRRHLLTLCLIRRRRRRSKYLKRFWVRAIFLRRKSSSNSLKKWEEKTMRVSSLISSGCFLIILTTSWHSLLTLQFFSSDQLKETFTFSLLFAAIFVSTSTACDFFKHFHWPVMICSRDQGDVVEFILLRCECSQARCELLANARSEPDLWRVENSLNVYKSLIYRGI